MEPNERRGQIIDHAAKLFGDKGYHDTSISDIIASSQVARGTFYLYFANKRTIFEELVNSLLLRLSTSIQTIQTESNYPPVRDQIMSNFIRIIALLCEERYMLAILFRGAVGLDKETDQKLQDFYNEIINAIQSSLIVGQKMKIVRPCDTRMASLVALGAFKEILQDLLNNGKQPETENELKEIAAKVLDICSKGVLLDGASIP